ncbi:MAG TPA: aminotransferase class IV [Candidatus Saccharimonadales bacterium]|nr:aminotransferase class IV [Candidatus Saccharimonadales bacterium]
MKNVHFLNGQLVDEDHLLISPRDLGYSRGYAVFEFMITSGGRPFMMDRHLDRLFNSCQAISLSVPWTKEQIADWVLQTVDANELGDEEMVMRIIISGGSSGTLTLAKTPTILIIVEARMVCPPEDYANGVRVLLTEFDRYEPQAKTTNYVQAIRVMNAAPHDVNEIIYYSNNIVREGTRSNVFAIINGVLTTPKTGILGGVTRGLILNDLKLSTPAEARDFTVQELLSATEVFITATGKEVMPVIKINDAAVGDGTVGDVTKEVMSKFKNFFESYNHETSAS